MHPLYPEVKVAPPGPNARAIIDLDKRYTSPSYIKEYPLVVERGEGPWVHDVDGNRFLDFMAGIAVAATGHAHPHVVKAIQEAAGRFLHICGTDFYYDGFSRLCERLANYLPEMGPKKVFLTNSGTEAVEGALKLARHHTRRQTIIAFKGGFHGRTYGAISLNSSKVAQRAFFGPLLPGVLHIPYANPYRCANGCAPGACGDACNPVRLLETDWFVNHVDPREVAAIFVEPILGEGGYVVPSAGFLQDLRRLCDAHGILLVFDEVQSGIGRTGRMFAAEHFGVMPDILLSAKGIASGMPLGAIIAREAVMTWPRGSHGSTYGGNPVCCAAALATLDVVEGLLDSVRDTGEHLQSGLKALQRGHPVIGDVRGVGLMVGAEFVHPNTREPASAYVADLEQLAFQKGLLLLSCGKSTIRFAPPLVVGRHEVDVMLGVLGACLQELDVRHGMKGS
ncbi:MULTISPECIES: acetyl ornithine aminotransferase family protein [Corallococcus]|uniref:acetyl ornithine aminotransferase family protein n=1 Tax=Corallococcus TaxID=83461 RepID=UPI00117F9D7A|nr:MULTISPECIES: acetyl ornithine aminotransferase family protein [Corallococcus]NBD14286.1 acetyl ornithine aminotransferase family protein [Corallococcus silvisoli]TSC29373.1 acetyl ornithine aminotransferase family protein [Corallococcus sp. Z5C101001]